MLHVSLIAASEYQELLLHRVPEPFQPPAIRNTPGCRFIYRASGWLEHFVRAEATTEKTPHSPYGNGLW